VEKRRPQVEYEEVQIQSSRPRQTQYIETIVPSTEVDTWYEEYRPSVKNVQVCLLKVFISH
jgi:hypothetical protein